MKIQHCNSAFPYAIILVRQKFPFLLGVSQIIAKTNSINKLINKKVGGGYLQDSIVPFKTFCCKIPFKTLSLQITALSKHLALCIIPLLLEETGGE